MIPNLDGLRTPKGLIVGSEKTRAKIPFRYRVMNPETGEVSFIAGKAISGILSDGDTRQGSLLIDALKGLLEEKARFQWRGYPALRVQECDIHLMEAGPRGTLWPRYIYKLPYMDTHIRVLWRLCVAEATSKELVGVKDVRNPVTLSEIKGM